MPVWTILRGSGTMVPIPAKSMERKLSPVIAYLLTSVNLFVLYLHVNTTWDIGVFSLDTQILCRLAIMPDLARSVTNTLAEEKTIVIRQFCVALAFYCCKTLSLSDSVSTDKTPDEAIPHKCVTMRQKEIIPETAIFALTIKSCQELCVSFASQSQYTQLSEKPLAAIE